MSTGSRSLVIFWTTLARTDVVPLKEAVQKHDAALRQVTIELLPLEAVAALATGAVVAVCENNREASQALSAGVDEVLRSGEVTGEVLDATIERAWARAEARSPRALRAALLSPEVDVARALLASAATNGIEAQFEGVAEDWELLVQSLPAILEASDDLVAWTSQASRDTPRRIAARRLAAPSSSAVREVVVRLKRAVARGSELLRAVARVSPTMGSATSASAVVGRVVDVLRGSIDLTTITLDARPGCACAVPDAAIVVITTSLIANALESIRAARKSSGNISVRVFEVERAVVIEVEDDGKPPRADLRSSARDLLFADGTGRRQGLAGIQDRVRALGGELIVDAHGEGSIVRVMLPVDDAFAEVSFGGAVAGDRKALD